MAKRDIYIAIMRAAAIGQGVHLSADECFDLSMDDAIATRAGNGLDASELTDNIDFAKVNPWKPRKAANGLVPIDQDDHRMWPTGARS